MYVWGFVVFAVSHYYVTQSTLRLSPPQSQKSLVIYSPSPSEVSHSTSPLFAIGDAVIQLQKTKVEYLSDGFDAIKSISESTSVSEIIWSKFEDVMKLIKSFLLLYIIKYFLI